jgi:hypothetical protein
MVLKELLTKIYIFSFFLDFTENGYLYKWSYLWNKISTKE